MEVDSKILSQSEYCNRNFQCSRNDEHGKEHRFNSTFCIYPSDEPQGDCELGCEGFRSQDDLKKVWIGMHNYLRSTVAEGKLGMWPKARNMQQLLWHDELYRAARRWLKQCRRGGDKCRTTKSFVGHPNQLIGLMESKSEFHNFTDIFVDWMNEYKAITTNPEDIKKGIIARWPKGIEKKFKHFGQLIWAKTRYVGCDVVQFRNSSTDLFETHVACNYFPPGWGLHQDYSDPDPFRVYELREVAENCSCGYQMDCRPNSTYPNLCAKEGDPEDEEPIKPEKHAKTTRWLPTIALSSTAMFIIAVAALCLFWWCCCNSKKSKK